MVDSKKGTMIRVNGVVYEWLLVERANKTIERKKPESFSNIISDLIEKNENHQQEIKELRTLLEKKVK